jgi:hypothetical protein
VCGASPLFLTSSRRRVVAQKTSLKRVPESPYCACIRSIRNQRIDGLGAEREATRPLGSPPRRFLVPSRAVASRIVAGLPRSVRE